MTEKIGNKDDENDNKNKNKNSSNSLNNEIIYNHDNTPDLINKYKNRIKNNKNNKNSEINYIYEDYNIINNDIKIFDLNSISYYKNYNNIKELKEKIKKELDNKKVKYNIKKNKYCCCSKKVNKFEIELFPINEYKNIYIIKCIKKFGNTLDIKDVYNFILTKINSS